jgi:hypothetical protein
MSNEQLTMTNEQGAASGNLLAGQLVRLAAFNPETDAEIVARWTRDTEYHRLGDNHAAYPQPVKWARDLMERPGDRSFGFTIRTLADDR